jgi:phage replication O-like protein O
VADVQLEHGHVRVANALYEAIVYASFTGVQGKIVHCLIRLTYGWRQRSAQISMPDLAGWCNVAPSGGFRRALDELIAEGVIIEVARGHGRTPSCYAVNKDFERWGRFSVASRALEGLFGRRPSSVDSPTLTGQSIVASPAPVEADYSEADEPLSAHVGELSAPVGVSSAPMGAGKKPEAAAVSADTTAERQERQERQLLQQRAEQFAIRLTSTANNAIAERWGEATRTRPIRWDTATQLCIELLQIGVDPELACQAVADSARASKKPAPPRSISYFADVITDAHKAAEQRALDEQHPAPKGRVQPSRVTVGVRRGGEVFVASKDREEHARRSKYSAARAAAGVAWGKDPANQVRYAEILEEVTAKHATTIETSWGRNARDIEVVSRCADAADFPSYDAWLDQHQQELAMASS